MFQAEGTACATQGGMKGRVLRRPGSQVGSRIGRATCFAGGSRELSVSIL